MEEEIPSDCDAHGTSEPDPSMERMSMTESVLEGMNMLDAVLEQASSPDMDQYKEPEQETVYEVEREESEVPPESKRETVYEVEPEPASIRLSEPKPSQQAGESVPVSDPEADLDPVGTSPVRESPSVPDSVLEEPSTQELGVPEGPVPVMDTQDVSLASGDALLADLESTTSHISKRPVFLPDETPYSFPTGGNAYPEVSATPPVPPHPTAEALNGTVLDPPDSHRSSTQSIGSAQKSTWSRDSSSPPLSHGEEDHVYSFPNKQKTTDSAAAGMSSSLGSNLSELDRLLLELNAVQHSTPSFPVEEAPPALPSSSVTTQNGISPPGKAPPPTLEKPKRNAAGRGIEDVRPSVESLLDQLESSVPTPVPAPSVATVELSDGQEETPSQQQARISASSATRELDELMASLSDFKVQSNIMAQGKGGSPTSPPKQGNKLDNMLGSLQSDLNRLGVQTVAKGVCGACKKPIAGQVVTAMGRTWHPEHFVCTHCQDEIGSRNFFERDGQPYCEKDYHNLFSPRCHYCNGPILDKVVTALDRTWHPEHFFCAQCGAFFGPEGFHEKDGKAYCRKDYFDMFAPKCGGCARAILENYISALNSLWHPECFVCRECFTPFINGSFFEHEGQPYCEAHYHERRGSLCSGCQKPITGRCITAMGKKFHPEHFVCAFCLKQLNKGTFKEQNDKPYCQGCFIKLFS
ncbi:paxillin a isoform X2 [Alosa pseudoharengus]|uniref:paxillin a isoform X2 n=1 Tax=Alosa pseudoharengus TaxID=34774 RepID=UPI003F8AA684